MRFRWAGAGKLVGAIITLGVLATRVDAQYSVPSVPVGRITPMPEGNYAQVVTVTPAWLVLQNEQGQQFPVARASVRRFLLRWPTTADRVEPDAWVVAAGRNQGSNRILTDHVDVINRDARALAPEPTRVSINENGEIVVPLYSDTYETQFGDDFRQPQDNRLPVFLYVVGPLVNRNPLVVGTPGDVAVAAFGPKGPPPLSLVTMGPQNFGTFVRAGDQVWYDTSDFNPRSLVLDELMVYKTMPFDQFAP